MLVFTKTGIMLLYGFSGAYASLMPGRIITINCQRPSFLCVFLGYALSQKGYKCLLIELNWLYVSRHVVFDELTFPLQTSELNSDSYTTLNTWLEHSDMVRVLFGYKTFFWVCHTEPRIKR